MRKFVLVLVAVMAVSAIAAPTVVLDKTGLPAGQVAIKYTSDGNLPSGFGLTVSVDAGNITAVDGFASKFNIYPGSIVIDGNGVVTDAGSAVVTTLPAASVVLEMGALYDRSDANDPNKPAASGTLCVVTVSANCTVTLAGNDARCGAGMGVITEDYAAYAVNDTESITLDCLSSSAPYYAKWVEYGKPDCWCYRKNCRGDADGILTATKPVMNPDLLIFKSAFNKTKAQVKLITNGICADFDRIDTATKPVMNPDLIIFKAYFNKLNSQVPQCNDGYVLIWKN